MIIVTIYHKGVADVDEVYYVAIYPWSGESCFLYRISEITVSTGKFLNKKFKLDAGVKLSEAKDIKTKADLAASDFAIYELKKISDLKIVSEEDKKLHCEENKLIFL